MYCRHCGNEIEDDSRFCPYCGREVRTVAGTEEATVSTNVPNEQEAEQVPPAREPKKNGIKKLVLAASIVLGLAALGVGISALANNVKVNKKSSSESIKATATPTPTKAPTKAPTKTPTPTKVPTINDVAMLIYGAPVELGTEHKVVRIQLVENDYDGKISLVYEIEDTSIVSCEWGEWAKDNTIPLRIYPEGIGETTITIKLADSNVCKEIKVYSNGDYTFANFSKTMYAKSSVNVRSLPSTDGTKLGSLEEGEMVEVTGQCNETNWYRIVYNGKTAFVSGNYLLETVEQAEPEVTDVPKPTETPVPAKTATADDMKLRLSATRIEVDDTPQIIKVEIIENGYTDWDSLKCYVEDKSIVTYAWDDWENTGGYVCPLIITAKSAGETTITVLISDAEGKTIVSKEIKVSSTYEPSLENVKLEVSPESVHVGEKPQTVIVKINRNGYSGSMSLTFFVEDETIAGAKWDKDTEETDLIIYGKKKGTTSVFVGVSGGKGLVEIKVTSDGATVMATPTPKPTATPKPAATATPTPKPAATSTPKPTATPKPAATATPAPTSSKSSYTVKSSSGLEMSVKPGFAATVTTRTKYAETKEQAKLLLPDLETWSGGQFFRSSAGEKDTYKTIYYHADKLNKEDSMALLSAYFDLLAEYEVYVNVNETYSKFGGYYYEWHDMDYTGNVSITEGAVTSYDDLPCDLNGWYSFEGFGDVIYGINYPKEAGFVDTGERYTGKTEKLNDIEMLQNTSAPRYTITSNGLDSFKVSGWGWDSEDYVLIYLHPDLYEKGDVFTLQDFAAQADAGDGRLNALYVQAEDIGKGEWSYENLFQPNKDNIDKFTSVRVEIIEKTDALIVINYVIKMRSDFGDDYVLEGLFAVKTENVAVSSGGSSSSSSGSSSIGIPSFNTTSDCIYCEGGYEKCIVCHGKGYYTCGVCKGVGSVSHYGYTSDCSCDRGKVRCTAFGCVNGYKKCNICGGKGVK
ncbi:MAG: SH3 domain-containing protein [Lachnospiraceae bacterium]|nr:SH3 domain-containing protein [Lachnospiraceae bacterium]